MKRLSLVLVLIALTQMGWGEMKSSVSHWGITWTFDKEYECGRFVSDDWWVVGPVTITSVSPAPTSGRSGTVVDPAAGVQGYDSRTAAFSASVRASFPLAVSGTKSVVSTISKPADERSDLQSAAVLTVVTTAPSTNAFRPPFIKGDKPFFLTSDIRLDWLPNLDRTRVPTVTDQVVTDYEADADGIWLDHIENYVNQGIHPAQHMAPYSRDFANTLSHVAVVLMLDNKGKDRKLLYHFLQRGIDFYYQAVQNDHLWPANGGHANGRKWPIVFAGIMFDKAEMRTKYFRCNEDEQTYYGVNGKALWGQDCVSPYTATCSGSGSKTCRDPNGLKDGCPSYRNCCTSFTWMGAGLAAMIMGAKPDWNHNAHFDYLDRWIAENISGSTNPYYNYGGSTVQFAWQAFRADVPYVDYSGITDVIKKIKVRPGMGNKLFSNPVEDIELCGLKGMTIYNQTGQLVSSGSSLEPGVYYVEFEDRVERLVVVK